MRAISSLLLAIIVTVYSMPPTFAEEPWKRLKSKNFIFYTNVDEAKARKTLVDLEKFRFTVGLITRLDLSEDYSPPLIVFGFNDTKEYLKNVGPSGTGGFYIPQPQGAASALTLEDGDEEWQGNGIEVIFHEYSHHIIHQYSPIQYPRWYDEGFGEFVSTMEFKDGKAIIGKPVTRRFPILKTPSHWLRMKEIFNVKGEYLSVVRGRSRVGQLYAQGWLVTHFLQNSNKYRDAITPFFHGLNDPDVDVEKLFKKTFKTTYSKFDKEIRKYWYGRDFPFSTIDLKARLPEIKYDYRVLSDDENAFVIDEARLVTGRFYGDSSDVEKAKKEAVEHFNTALEKGVRPLDMNLYLSRLALESDQFELATKHVEQALVLAPTDPRVLTLKGLTIIESVKREKRDATLLKSGKRWIVKALKQDKTYVPALLAYVDIALHKGQKIKRSTLKIVESIRFLSPDLVDGRELEVRVLAKLGDYEAAKEKLNTMISWANSKQQAKRFKKMMENLENEAPENQPQEAA